MTGEKTLRTLIEEMKDAGEWDAIHSTIADFLIDDVEYGMVQNKKERKAYKNIIAMYGNPTQIERLSYAL